MSTVFKNWIMTAVALSLGGCAILPSGPSVLVLPGTGKNFEQFRADDYMCRQYAVERAGGEYPNEVAVESEVASAVIGTALGAAAGAVMGGERGAGVGAGAGLLMGSLMAADAGNRSGYELQQIYDNNYLQCMYANGHQIPSYGQPMTERDSNWRMDQPTTQPLMIPPPPPGPPPPPPPGIRPW